MSALQTWKALLQAQTTVHFVKRRRAAKPSDSRGSGELTQLQGEVQDPAVQKERLHRLDIDNRAKKNVKIHIQRYIQFCGVNVAQLRCR